MLLRGTARHPHHRGGATVPRRTPRNSHGGARRTSHGADRAGEAFRGRFFTERRAESSFPRTRESRKPALYGTTRLDARLRGHDGPEKPHMRKTCENCGRQEKPTPERGGSHGGFTPSGTVRQSFLRSVFSNSVSGVLAGVQTPLVYQGVGTDTRGGKPCVVFARVL